MAQSLTIVRAAAEHVEAASVLFDAYRQFYGQASDLEAARVFIRERIARGESVIFIATGAGACVGFTQLYPSFSSVDMTRLWILNDLFVAPEARRQGVGEALLERARGFAEETGARGLVLETATDNLTAQQLYERLGWVRETQFYTYNLRV